MHPNETELALYAGNDLGRLARLRVDWHLRTCGKCQQGVTEFSSLRAETMRSASEPEVNWDRLSAEMKANIRLGLEAGKCIAPAQSAHFSAHFRDSRFGLPGTWKLTWAAVATAAMIALAVSGEVWLNHPFSLNGSANGTNVVAATPSASMPQDVVLEAKGDGIQMVGGEGVMSELRSDSRGDVVHTVDVRGGVGASYVDRETGMVTVNNIYYGQ